MCRVGVSALLSLWLAGCGERPAEHSAPTAVSAPVQRLEAPLSDVAMLQLQPDGSYRRVCGEPSTEVRAMLDGVRRARRARK
jgi:hypothetical protein